MSTQERKASIREFYGIEKTFYKYVHLHTISIDYVFVFSFFLISSVFSAVIFPSLMQLQSGLNDMEEIKQKVLCTERYRRKDDERMHCTDIDAEREEECAICMETSGGNIVLPSCMHTMCLKCFQDWYKIRQILTCGDLLVFKENTRIMGNINFKILYLKVGL
jgi:Zinc finger, C3HC4 type (RING finger)